MKFTVTLPYVRRGRYSDSPLERPYLSAAYTVVSEVVGKSVTVSFEQGVLKGEGQQADFGHLTTFPNVVSPFNVDQVLELVAAELGVNRVPNKYTLPVVEALLTAKGWNNDRVNFDMLDDQEGWGFMGGTGCGVLVHKLLYTKVLGVKPELTGVRRTLAAMQFNAWLGQVKEIRAESKHLREAVSEDELFVTYNAHPICQATVRYHHARGFLVEAANESHCSCTKCAAKLGITANAKRNGIAITTPDTMEHGGITFTYTKVTKTSAWLHVTSSKVELVDRKTLNAAIKERGQKLAYTDAPRGVRGIWYVDALKTDTTGLMLKMERGPKDAMFAQARILVDRGLLQKGA